MRKVIEQSISLIALMLSTYMACSRCIHPAPLRTLLHAGLASEIAQFLLQTSKYQVLIQEAGQLLEIVHGGLDKSMTDFERN